jgi:fructose-bisphosphate aldolase class I
MNLQLLKDTIHVILAEGKGILAADESNPTCTKRFEAVGVASTEENRRAYREILFTTPGIEQYLGGVILFEETLKQKTMSGVPFPEVLAKRGIIPGIKVDKGTKDLALHPDEKITEGLDGLRERLQEYKALGARFAKWRAVIAIGSAMPTPACLRANAHALARYAAICEEADMVPILEPEVLLDGNHTLERSYEVTRDTLKILFGELAAQGVPAEGVILKTSMVIAGKEAPVQSSPEEVASATVRCLKEALPENLGGVVFLSGGQGDEQATANLNAINQIGGTPWRLTFSYARALQNPVLKFWAEQKPELAQKVYLFRAKANGLASTGRYDPASEKTRSY